jgi:hypothetical protein
MKLYLHCIVYFVFAGIVALLMGIVGFFLVVDQLWKRFIDRADYF